MMGAIVVFNEYKGEIQQLFRSELRIIILLALCQDGRSLPELEKITSSASSAIINKSKLWMDHGFVEKNDNKYELTDTGGIITGKIISLLQLFDSFANSEYRETDQKEAEASPDPTALIKLYHDNMEFANEIFSSPIMMTLLLHLSESAKTRDQLKEITGSTSPVITPKLRWLKTNSIIEEDDDEFRLTLKGQAFVKEFEGFIFTSATLIKHSGFWKAHIISQLPDFALDSIGDLVYTNEVHDTPEEPFKNYENWMKIIAEAENLHSISNYATPGVSDAIAKRAMEGVPMDIVISGELAMKIFEEPYIKYMKDYENYPHMQWFIANFPRIVSFTVTDKCFTIKFSGNTVDAFDTSSGLVSRSKEAREWGERLFQHYKSSAIPIRQFIMEQIKK